MAFMVGWPGGSSPVSVEAADNYFTDRGVAAWAGSVAAKEGALTRATDYVKALFAYRFDPALFLVIADQVVIPEALANGIFGYALVELQTPGGLAPAPAVDASGFSVVKTKKKVGPIETDFTVVGGNTAQRQIRRSFPVPDAWISALLLPVLGMTRSMR